MPFSVLSSRNAERMSTEVGHTTSVQLPAIPRTLLKNHDFLAWRETAMDQLAQLEEHSD